MRTSLLEPLDAAALPDVHIDLHVPENAVIRHNLYSADEVTITVGVVSLHLKGVVLDRLLEHGVLAKEDLEVIARYPDPLPEI